MPPKYPKFKTSFDMSALEQWMIAVTKVLSRSSDKRTAAFLKGLLLRTSPEERAKFPDMDPNCEEMRIARFEDWDGTD